MPLVLYANRQLGYGRSLVGTPEGEEVCINARQVMPDSPVYP